MNVFSRIYRANEWNGVETRSGPGSHREPTRRVAGFITAIVKDLNIESVLDVGCGEGSWMPDLPGYLGIDVAPEAIAEAKRNHPDREYALYRTQYSLPDPGAFDMVICRDVVQHLAMDRGLRLLGRIADLGAGYLLASTYIGGTNTDIVTGEAYSPDLEAAPFNLPPALLLIHDGYAYDDGDRLRDPRKMLGLWRL